MTAESRRLVAFYTVIVGSVVVSIVAAQNSCTTQRKESGVCVPILRCKTITDILSKAPRPPPPSIIYLVRSSQCAGSNRGPHVCCEPDGVTGGQTSQSETTTTQKTAFRNLKPANSPTSNIHSGEDASTTSAEVGMRILEETRRCGISNGDKVANGDDANLSEYPWMALLIYETASGARTLDCGGSLITNRYVLTAAHCIRTGNKKLISVRLGEYDTKQDIDCVSIGKKMKCAPPAQEIDIEEAIYHKDFNPSEFSNDIGLIRLSRTVNFADHIQAICLPITPNSNSLNLMRLLISGWGKIENGFKASILQKAILPIVDNNSCGRVHRGIDITDKHLCAGGENEVATCPGDSGGPVFFSARFRKGARYIQYGIVSAGSSACGTNFPGIYVKVSSYLPWIAANMRA